MTAALIITTVVTTIPLTRAIWKRVLRGWAYIPNEWSSRATRGAPVSICTASPVSTGDFTHCDHEHNDGHVFGKVASARTSVVLIPLQRARPLPDAQPDLQTSEAANRVVVYTPCQIPRSTTMLSALNACKSDHIRHLTIFSPWPQPYQESTCATLCR